MPTSEFVVNPKRFCGLRVLLIDTDKSSMDHHAYILSRNSYRVTATPEVATGLSKILNGESYDCVLIDADINEGDMVDFLHQTFKHQPQLSIIMMASNNIGMRLFKETLENEAILCLPKPCDPSDICNISQHVLRKKALIEGGDYLNGESPEENQEHNIFKRIEHPMVTQSRTLNPTLINDNLSPGSSTHEGLNINSQEYGVMFRPRTLSNDHDQEHVDHETNIKENISSSYTVKNVDKGKQPREDDTYFRKRRITWTRDLHKKFLEAINELGKQEAYPTNILEVMKVPGLTRSQVASHLQKYQENQKIIKNPNLVPQMKRGNSLQVKSYTHKISDNHPSILPFPSNVIQRPRKLNSIGIAYMTLNNIKARLQRARSLPITTNNSSESNQSTDNSFCHLFQPSMGETRMITTSALAENCNSSTGQRNEVQRTGNNGYGRSTGPVDAASFSNSFVSENCEGVGASLTPLDYSGIAIKPWVSGKVPSVGEENYNPEMCEILNPFEMTNSGGGGGGTSEYSSNHNDLLPSQDFQLSGANLFPSFLNARTLDDDVERFKNPNFSNSDLATFEVEGVGYSHACFPVEENNSEAQTLPPFDYNPSVDGFEQSDSYSDGSQWNLDMTVNLLEELDVHLINGPW